MGQSVRRRLIFLLAGNAVLLAGIWFSLTPGSSFGEVLLRAGPDIAPVVLAGFALTGIIFAGAIDLSIGSALALAGTVFGVCVFREWSALLAFAACAAVGWAAMSLNGWLITRLNIPAIIVTLAGLPLYRGIALIVADVAVPGFSGNVSITSEEYHGPGKAYPGLILLFGIFLAVMWEAFSKHPRSWLALGSSPEACRLIGLQPRQVLNSAFLWGGLFFSLAVLIYVTRVQAIEPARIALGFELQVIAAVILGGTNIFGGEGSYLGTLLGAFFLYFVSQLMIYAGASAYLQDAMTGAIILLIIGIDCALNRQSKLMEELS